MFGVKKMTQGDGSVVFHDPPIAQFLFGNSKMAIVWLIVRLYVGWSWLEGGLHKLFAYDKAKDIVLWGQLDPDWMLSGKAIRAYWERVVTVNEAGTGPITFDWFRVFLNYLIAINAEPWMSKIIVFGELLVGLGLIVGAFVGVAAFFGALMNMSFMLAGSASTNPVLFLLAVGLMLAWKVAGYYGLDRWLLAMLGTPWESLRVTTTTTTSGMPPPAPAPTH